MSSKTNTSGARDALLDAATQLVEQQPGSPTLATIAKRAGLAGNTWYRKLTTGERPLTMDDLDLLVEGLEGVTVADLLHRAAQLAWEREGGDPVQSVVGHLGVVAASKRHAQRLGKILEQIGESLPMESGDLVGVILSHLPGKD